MLPSALTTSSSCLQFSDVVATPNEIVISILHFKSFKTQGPQTICLHRRPRLCPVKAVTNYLLLRGVTPGPLFVHQSGRPCLRREFDRILKLVLTFCSLDPSRFKGHSFRIGAATEAAAEGKSDAQIRLLGRWASDAFRKYIRFN